VEIELSAFLTTILDGGELSTSCPSHFTPRERSPNTHWIGDWVGPRASLDMVAKRKKLLPCVCWKSNPDLPACSLVTVLVEEK